MLRRYSSVAATQSSAQPEAQQAQPQEQAPRPQVVSSCKEGTVLKGLNVLKDGKDPVAKADSGYPAWLWTLLDPKEPPVEKKDQLSIHHLRSLSREKIRAFALSKQTKY